MSKRSGEILENQSKNIKIENLNNLSDDMNVYYSKL